MTAADFFARHGGHRIIRRPDAAAHRAARDARNLYVAELMAAAVNGDDTERDAADWLARLRELCGPYRAVFEQAGYIGWYRREEARLVALMGGEQ